MEGTHRELSSWLTDRLSGDDTHRSTDSDDICRSKVETITLLADSFFCLTREDRSDRYFGSTRLHDLCEDILRDEGRLRNDDLSFHVNDILRCIFAIDLVLEGITKESF